MIKATLEQSNRQYHRYRQYKHAFFKSLPYSSLIAIVLFFSLILTGCAGQTQQAQDVSGHIKISGSTALLPLVTAAGQAFQKQHPRAKIDVSGGGSLTGLQAVTTSKVNIGDSDIYADPATFPDPNLTDHIVCVTPFVMIVNRDVTINSLSRQQIIDIYSTGKYQNWQELNGPNVQIYPIVRPGSSGTRATFRKYILNGLDEHGKINLQVDDTKKVVNMVATTPGAIGYVALSAVTPAVKYIAIDGQTPTTANIAAGKYNFWSYEHMYTLGDDNPLVYAFLNYITDTAMQSTVRQMHYIPINDMNLPATSNTSTTNRSSLAVAADAASQESEDRRYE
jgi:ABC-type phosphate transport system, periplasmic component